MHPPIHRSSQREIRHGRLPRTLAPRPGQGLLPAVIIALRRIRPSKYSGGLATDDVSFAYPSRPAVPALFDVFIVPSDQRDGLHCRFLWFWQIHRGPSPTSFRRCTNLRNETSIPTNETCERRSGIGCGLTLPALVNKALEELSSCRRAYLIASPPLSMAILLAYHHARRLKKPAERPSCTTCARSPTRIRHLSWRRSWCWA